MASAFPWGRKETDRSLSPTRASHTARGQSTSGSPPKRAPCSQGIQAASSDAWAGEKAGRSEGSEGASEGSGVGGAALSAGEAAGALSAGSGEGEGTEAAAAAWEGAALSAGEAAGAQAARDRAARAQKNSGSFPVMEIPP